MSDPEPNDEWWNLPEDQWWNRPPSCDDAEGDGVTNSVLELLENPSRREIVQQVQVRLKRLSARELLGLCDSLGSLSQAHFHTRRLEEVGLIRSVRTSGALGQYEARYSMPEGRRAEVKLALALLESSDSDSGRR